MFPAPYNTKKNYHTPKINCQEKKLKKIIFPKNTLEKRRKAIIFFLQKTIAIINPDAVS